MCVCVCVCVCVRNYALADLHSMHDKYKPKRPIHILL